MPTFLERLAESVKRLLSSGKVITALAGAIVYLAAKRNIILHADDVQGILILFGVLLGAQGAADLGKSAAVVAAAAPAKPDTVQIQQNVAAPPEKK